MSKTTLALAAGALVLAAPGFVTSAQAHGRGGHFHFFQWTPTFPSESERYERERYERPVVRRVIVHKSAPAKPAAVTVKYADGRGRIYDRASKTWFDGKSQCWSGAHAFLFKGGSWLYADEPWRQVKGTWQTDAEDPPSPVDCSMVAVFAGKIKQPQTLAKKDTGEAKNQPVATAANTEPVKETAPEKKDAGPAKANKPTETAIKPVCQRYFPSVGEMVAVPCS